MKNTIISSLLFLAIGLVSFISFEDQKEPIGVMTFNIRYNNPDDAPNDWPSRRDFVGELIQFYDPDFVGTQEVLYDQLKDMQQRLPEYKYIGMGRDDGKKGGEFSALFYKKADFELLRSETFWLSENPQQVGVMGWDAVCNRVVTWGEFKNKASGHTFFVFNTHFDHRGEVARKESAKLLLNKVKEIAGNSDAIITGDFNATPESDVYQRLTQGMENKNGFLDSYTLAEKPYGPVWTSHSFGKSPVKDRNRIDYVFTNKKAAVSKYVAISEQRGDIFPSDHLPVMTEIKF